MSTADPIVLALRDLVGAVFCSCQGAYGVESYEGQFEREIQAVAALLRQPAPDRAADVTDCRDCPFRRDHRGQGECWTECGHEAHGRPAYGNILWGCQAQFQATPSWCPLGLSSSPYMTPEQLGQLDRLLSKCIEENVSAWIASRINGASGSMIYAPNLSHRLQVAFDKIAERVKRGEGQT